MILLSFAELVNGNFESRKKSIVLSDLINLEKQSHFPWTLRFSPEMQFQEPEFYVGKRNNQRLFRAAWTVSSS